LAAQGVVNGYPDGTFQGQHNITRYEMAQMVAKALVRQDRVDAEQNAIINRLANEFSAELNNLGVRVATLENKVGNFKFTGDARLRFIGHEKTTTSLDVVEKDKEDKSGKEKVLTEKMMKKSMFDYRGRVQFAATVNDNTKAVIRLVGSKEFGAAGNPKTTIDRIYVQHNFGKYLTATAGRHDLTVGAGLTYDDVFEGATAMVGKDALNASVSYGYAPALGYNAVFGGTKDVPGTSNRAVKVGGFYTKVNGVKAIDAVTAINGIALDADSMKQAEKLTKKSLDFYGVNASVKLGHNLMVDGEFAKYVDLKHSNAWTAGIAYGAYDMKKAGTWMLKAQYVNLDVMAPVFSSTYMTPYNQNYKTWSVLGKYAIAKNVGLAAYSTIGAKDKAGNDVADFYRAELNYKF